jgi:hypothetical protein
LAKEKLMETFLKIISLLKMPLKVVFLIAVVTGLLLFLPNSIIERLQLSNFIMEFGKYMGIIFLITVGYLIVTAIPRIWILINNKINKNKFIKKIDETLSNLTFPEICFLREFILQMKEVIEVPIENTEYISLYNKGVVLIASPNMNSYIFGNYIFIKLNEIVKKNITFDLLSLPAGKLSMAEKNIIISERPQFLSALNFRDKLMSFR